MKLDNIKISQRIIKAFVEIGWNNNGIKKRIANELDVSPSSISKWMRGISLPTIDKIYLISKMTNKSIDWILYGSSSNHDISEHNSYINIDIISQVQAGAFNDIGDIDVESNIKISSDILNPNHKYFGLKIAGNSMYDPSHKKSLSDGEIVVIDPKLNPKIGDIVVAVTSENTATIKLLDGDANYKILKPLNKSYSNITEMNLKFAECNIIGVAVMSIYPPKIL